jgi:hypothetical protein
MAAWFLQVLNADLEKGCTLYRNQARRALCMEGAAPRKCFLRPQSNESKRES